uniref:Uncharacterized protein n=1 Tax=Staphylothermus marinus TaxID=2280 RepID=A0A7C4D7B9_STAMA
MEKPSNVSEYWFNNYYRVIVVKLSNDKKFVSVDVYRDKWLFKDYEEICISNNEYCLLYSEVDPLKYNHLFDNILIDKIIVTGVKSNKVFETINIRWFITGEIDYNSILKIFQYSWEIIGCKPPLDDPWVHVCID